MSVSETSLVTANPLLIVKAKTIRNAVTFDLIEVNKAARPKYRSVARAAADAAMKVLRRDIEDFLALGPVN